MPARPPSARKRTSRTAASVVKKVHALTAERAARQDERRERERRRNDRERGDAESRVLRHAVLHALQA